MLVKCKNCNKKFDKLPNQVRKHPNHFCSRSCSSSFNNKGKRKNPPKERVCSKCSTKFFRTGSHKSYLLCPSCRKTYDTHTDFIKSKTLKEYYDLPSIKDKHPSWRHSHVRVLNRSWNKELIKLPCSNCGYDKHVELAHIKAISSFPETATLGEINSPENNLVLCQNCHWEYDHDLL